MARYAIIDGTNVINVVEYDEAPSNPPPGFEDNIIAIQSEVPSPGWFYIDGEFVAPAVPDSAPLVVLAPEQKLAALGLTLAELKSLLGIN